MQSFLSLLVSAKTPGSCSSPHLLSSSTREPLNTGSGTFPETTTLPDTATPTLPRLEDTTAAQRGTGTTPWSLGGLCDFESSLCGWIPDSMSELSWSLHSGSISSGLTPSLDLPLTLPKDDVGNFLHIEASPKTERQRARLVSPAVGPERGPLCLLFNYQLQGPVNQGQGSLRILLRDNDQEETLLWALGGDQGPVWKEGRTILPQSPKEYQVVIEGYFEHGNRGHIWIDNIHMSSSTELEQCTQPFSAFPPDMTGGALPGASEPTVDTEVSVQPIPPYWYYVMAGVGALLLLASVTLVLVLCCHRYRLATKKNSQHSVSYQSAHYHSSHYGPGPNHNHYPGPGGVMSAHYPNGGPLSGLGLAGPTAPPVQPMLSVRLEKKNEHRSSQC